MNIDFKNVTLYPLNIAGKQKYRAVGHIDLYNMEHEIAGSIIVDVPQCEYDEINQMLIALDCVTKEVDE